MKTVISVGIIFTAFAGWILVQHAVRVFASRHPELGPAREEGGGCGTSCGCGDRLKCVREKKGLRNLGN